MNPNNAISNQSPVPLHNRGEQDVELSSQEGSISTGTGVGETSALMPDPTVSALNTACNRATVQITPPSTMNRKQVLNHLGGLAQKIATDLHDEATVNEAQGVLDVIEQALKKEDAYERLYGLGGVLADVKTDNTPSRSLSMGNIALGTPSSYGQEDKNFSGTSLEGTGLSSGGTPSHPTLLKEEQLTSTSGSVSPGSTDSLETENEEKDLDITVSDFNRMIQDDETNLNLARSKIMVQQLEASYQTLSKLINPSGSGPVSV